MGLKLSLPTDYGVVAEYWNIGALIEDFRNKGVEVAMYGYATKAARQANKQPLAVRKVQLVGSDYTLECTREDLYTKLKFVSHSDFAGAEDDQENLEL